MVVACENKCIMAGLGDVHVSDDPCASLECLGLGSCIGLCLYDPQARVGGMAHIVLPESNREREGSTLLPGKYADTAIPMLLQMMIRKGASKSRLVVKMAGGAQMLQSLGGAGIEMGARNIEMTRKALAKEGLGITACDTGGNKGRSLWLEVGTGRVMVKIIGSKPTEL
jgi:chemotaxis protein CheD